MTGESISSAQRIASLEQRDAIREAELARLAREHQSDAWTAIYHENHAKLFRYVYARIGERETAEDLAATVFLEALKSIGGYRHTGRPLLAWLYTIARNVVNQHHRARFRRGAHGIESGDPAFIAAEHPEQQVVERVDLRDAVIQLPDSQREVVLLHYFVGLTIPEVAGVLGKRERAVYSLQTRAIKGIRRRLDEGEIRKTRERGE